MQGFVIWDAALPPRAASSFVPPGCHRSIDGCRTLWTSIVTIVVLLLIEILLYTVDGRIQLIWQISHLQGFIHPRWCRISSINSMTTISTAECCCCCCSCHESRDVTTNFQHSKCCSPSVIQGICRAITWGDRRHQWWTARLPHWETTGSLLLLPVSTAPCAAFIVGSLWLLVGPHGAATFFPSWIKTSMCQKSKNFTHRHPQSTFQGHPIQRYLLIHRHCKKPLLFRYLNPMPISGWVRFTSPKMESEITYCTPPKTNSKSPYNRNLQTSRGPLFSGANC